LSVMKNPRQQDEDGYTGAAVIFYHEIG